METRKLGVVSWGVVCPECQTKIVVNIESSPEQYELVIDRLVGATCGKCYNPNGVKAFHEEDQQCIEDWIREMIAWLKS